MRFAKHLQDGYKLSEDIRSSHSGTHAVPLFGKKLRTEMFHYVAMAIPVRQNLIGPFEVMQRTNFYCKDTHM